MNTKQIMTNAWNFARQGAAKFGGSVRQYIAAALRQAWKAAKAPSRKEIARDLDRAAYRASLIGQDAATSKQNWFLAGLLAANGESAADIGFGLCNSNAVLTKRAASIWIDRLAA